MLEKKVKTVRKIKSPCSFINGPSNQTQVCDLLICDALRNNHAINYHQSKCGGSVKSLGESQGGIMHMNGR